MESDPCHPDGELQSLGSPIAVIDWDLTAASQHDCEAWLNDVFTVAIFLYVSLRHFVFKTVSSCDEMGNKLKEK